MRRSVARLLGAAVLIAISGLATRSHAATPAGIDTARVRINDTDAFVVWPPGKGNAPSLVVVHESWGLNGQIRETAKKLARQGYVAIVPDLYHGKVASDPERAHELSRALDQPEAMKDLLAAIAWLRAQPRSSKGKIGVIGFCMGGSLAQGLAMRSPEVLATAMFYGGPETDPVKLASLHGPLMAHFGAEDDGIPVARVEEFRAGLRKAGKTAEVFVYPGAGHAFMHEGRPSYQPDASRQAWARTLAFLQKQIKT